MARQKDLERKERKRIERDQARKQARMKRILTIVGIVVVAVLIVLAIVFGSMNSKKAQSSDDGSSTSTSATSGSTSSGSSSSTGTDTSTSSSSEMKTDTDYAVQSGDTVALDYAGKVDGVAFNGGTGSYNLTLGSNSFIPGFEDQVIGHKVGETFDVTVTFPESYPNSPDLAGKEAVFTCKINGYTKAN